MWPGLRSGMYDLGITRATASLFNCVYVCVCSGDKDGLSDSMGIY